MESTKLASMEFSIEWDSYYALHRDRHFVDKVHFWRDIFPGNLNNYLEYLQPGESHKEDFSAGKFYPQGWAWRALYCFPQNTTPFRVIDRHKELVVADTYLKAGKFENMHTESIIGLPRPLTDKHIAKTRFSDPVFAVWANIKWP